MAKKKSQKVILSRPKDESLESYKAWTMEFARMLNPNAKDNMTEERWIEEWKAFWSKAEKPSD
jgi:hypothetical protein